MDPLEKEKFIRLLVYILLTIINTIDVFHLFPFATTVVLTLHEQSTLSFRLN